jgi:hypothetical protein
MRSASALIGKRLAPWLRKNAWEQESKQRPTPPRSFCQRVRNRLKTRELSFCLAQKTAKKRKRVRKRLILKGPKNATNCSHAQECASWSWEKG